MFSFLPMERRMAALFLLALALIGWQATRTKPLSPPPLAMAWTGGEQAFPIGAPWWKPLALPAAAAARYQALYQHSSLWPGAAGRAEAGGCEGFIRTGSSVWVRRGLDPRLLASPGRPASGRDALRFAAADFLDDDDGDGDALDPGELTRSGAGAEVEVFCPPPATGGAQP